MKSVTIYKLIKNKHKELIEEVTSNGYKEQNYNGNLLGEFSTYKINLYFYFSHDDKELNWEWVLGIFGLNKQFSLKKQPKAIVIINTLDDIFVLTFGMSYSIIKKYSYLEFGIDFASRLEYDEVKLMEIAAPNLKRNKAIYGYNNYKYLDFDSGESVLNLKLILKDTELNNVDCISKSVEVGTSIKLDIKINEGERENNLNNILKTINFIEGILKRELKNEIPRFEKLNKKQSSKLDEKLENALYEQIVEEKDRNIIIPEILSGNIEKNSICDCSYIYRINRYKKLFYDISFENIKQFYDYLTKEQGKKVCKKDLSNMYIKIDDNEIKLKDIIEYFDEYDNVLICGQWYRFNKLYKVHMENFISQIRIVYNQEYQFDKTKYKEYKNIKLKDSKLNYYEYAFNRYMEEEKGFENRDRKHTSQLGFEEMDLYDKKNKIMFSVKKGNSSGALCYCVNQSLTSLEHLKNDKKENDKEYSEGKNRKRHMPEIKKVGLWFILERNKLPILDNGNVDLNKLNMINLKISICDWIKKVRVAGYEPIIYVNYYSKD